MTKDKRSSDEESHHSEEEQTEEINNEEETVTFKDLVSGLLFYCFLQYSLNYCKNTISNSLLETYKICFMHFNHSVN